MPHWTIINGNKVFGDHNNGGRVGNFADAKGVEVASFKDDHAPSKIIIENQDEKTMEKLLAKIQQVVLDKDDEEDEDDD